MNQNSEQISKNKKIDIEGSIYIPNGLLISIISLMTPLLIYYSEYGLLLIWLPGILFRYKVWSYHQGIDFRPILAIFGFIFTGLLVFIFRKLISLIRKRNTSEGIRDEQVKNEFGILYTISGIAEIILPFIWLYLVEYSFSLEYIFLGKGLGLFQYLWPFIGLIGLLTGGILTIRDCFNKGYIDNFYDFLRRNKRYFINLSGILLIIAILSPSASFVYREPISQNISIWNPFAFELIWSWGLIIGKQGMSLDISPYSEFWFPLNIKFRIDLLGILFTILSLYLGIKLIRYKGEKKNKNFLDGTKPHLILTATSVILLSIWIVDFTFFIWDGYWGSGSASGTITNQISGPILFLRWMFYYPGFGVIGPYVSLILIIVARKLSKRKLQES